MHFSDVQNSVTDTVLHFRDLYLSTARENWWLFHIGALTATGALVHIVHSRLRTKAKPPGVAKGCFVAPGFEDVQKVFEENLSKGLDRGGSFAVYYKGKLVVNLYGGYADEEGEVAWNEDTVAICYSATKFTNAVIAGILVDRGHLSLDAPISQYWPEFGQHGKDKVTVGQLLSHQAGCPILTQEWTMSLQLNDIEKFGEILASQKPIWKPGTEVGYHLITIGQYFDQIVRRVDPEGRSLKAFFEEEIAKPLDLNYRIGLPLSETYKAARMYFNFKAGYSVPPMKYFLFGWKEKRSPYAAWTRFKSKDWGFGKVNDPYFRVIGDSSTHGYTNALSAAKMCSNLATNNPEPRLVSEKSIEMMGTPLTPPGAEDLHFHSKIRWGPGSYVLECKCGKEHFNLFGGLAYGGTMHVVDPRFQLGFAYVTNYMNPYAVTEVDPRYKSLKDALYRCMKKLENITEPIVGEFLSGPLPN